MGWSSWDRKVGRAGQLSEVELVELESQPVAVVRAHVSVAGIPGFLGEAYGEVMQLLNAQDLQPTGPPFGRYEREEGGFVSAGTAAMPLYGRNGASLSQGTPGHHAVVRTKKAGKEARLISRAAA
jgi:hypothetical protein